MSLPNPTPSPKPDPVAKSVSTAPLTPSAKIDGRPFRWRSLRLFALLVLASAGLHGLGMLVPIPETQEVIEKEDVPLEPIQISTLPPEIPEDLTEAPALPVEAPPPPPPEPEPQIIPEQPVAAPLPAALPEELFETPPVEPIEEEPVTEELPENTPKKDPEPKPEEQQPTRRAYDAAGTSSRDGQTGLDSFITSPDFGGAFNLGYGDLKIVSASGGSAPLLTVAYPAEDNTCFEGATSLALPVGVAAIVGDFEDDSGQTVRAVIEAQIVRKTGYAVVDQWIEDVVIGDIDVGQDIYEVIKSNSSDPLIAIGGAEELFSFGLIVELPEQPCS